MELYLDSAATTNIDEEVLSEYIKLLAPLIPLMYLDGSVDSMLKGLGQQVYSMRVNILDSLLSVVLIKE